MFKQKRFILIFGVIFIGLALFVNSLRKKYVLPIIMYHSVSVSAQPENRVAVSVDAFERQMRFLKRWHYNVVSLEAAADLIRGKKRIPPKTIAITFDDGYKDSYTQAFPILKKYHLPAAMFIIIDEVGRPQNDRLSWQEIKLMSNSGLVSFGSHCLGPEPLVNIKSEQEIRQQIFISKKILEQKIGKDVNMLSYPEGRFTQRIRQLVIDAGYKLAVTVNPGKSFSNEDVFALKRLRISSTSDSLFVFWVETSGYYNFMRENRKRKR